MELDGRIRAPLSASRYDRTREHVDHIFAWAEQVLSEQECEKVKAAVQLMIELHICQDDRPSGQPYVEHTSEVARNVIDWCAPTSSAPVIAACLHDSVEDQADRVVAALSESEPDRRSALESLCRRFGSDAANLVSQLTNPRLELPPDLDDAERRRLKIERYTEHVLSVFRNEPEAAAIKLADFGSNALRLDRLGTATAEDRRKKDRLREKYGPTMAFLREHLASLPPDHPLAARAEELRAEVEDAWKQHFAPREGPEEG